MQSVPGEEEGETFKREIKGRGEEASSFYIFTPDILFFSPALVNSFKGEKNFFIIFFFSFFGWAIIVWLLDEGEN